MPSSPESPSNPDEVRRSRDRGGLGWWWRRGLLHPRQLPGLGRYLWARLRHPEVRFEGFAFLGRGVELEVDRSRAELVIGRWAHIGDRTALRAHEGTLRIGDKCVIGRDVVVNCHLSLEIGASTLVADRCYLCDFDHRTDALEVAIKDQGIVKSPVRIGADCWIGAHVVVTRGTDLGDGSVAAALSVLRGPYPAGSIVAGTPAKVVADRRERHRAAADVRAYVDGLGRNAAERVRRVIAGEPVDDERE
ncbi:MAG TPA: acyltransferase [Candidatus Avipropionibacterium avicola]|uniref:Acyltransferase n=1 Tax=Candidatus Avipropionibacterium avicola TaxID=2840701 RepID=A0A9D1H071_9ACTN|nr:acyltransferase [Candidatus Avipropionibacterium avicola]